LAEVKDELADLERRWEISRPVETTFSKAEVARVEKEIAAVLQRANSKKPATAEAPAVETSKPADSKPAQEEKAQEPEQASGGKWSDLPVLAPARSELDALRSKARAVKARADQTSEEEIKAIEKKLRGDIEVVLAHDLTHLNEEELRARVVQLVLEIKDRNRWEALRMHELTKQHTEDLVKKYDALMQAQSDKYEELVRYESAAAAAKAAEHAKELAEDRFERQLASKEQQWEQSTKQRLEKQQHELGKEMEQRFNAAKASIEARAAEDLKARHQKLQQLTAKVGELQHALQLRAKADKSVDQVRTISTALVGLQRALYSDPANVSKEIERMEAATKGDSMIQSAIQSLPRRVREDGVAPGLDIAQQFSSVYDTCYRVSLVPEDGGVLQHAFAHIAAGLTFRDSKEDAASQNPQQVHLARARQFLVEQHNLEASVKEMQQLSGAVKESASDWLANAEDFLAVEQVIALIQSRLSSFSK
jgi:hypothetical protein